MSTQILSKSQCQAASDLLISDLAAREAELIGLMSSLETDVRLYRELALTAINALHDLTVKCDRLREQHHRLLDEYRRPMTSLMSGDEAA